MFLRAVVIYGGFRRGSSLYGVKEKEVFVSPVGIDKNGLQDVKGYPPSLRRTS